MNNINILNIHDSILKKVENGKKKLPQYKSKLLETEKILENNNFSQLIQTDLVKRRDNLNKKIKDIEDEVTFTLYTMESQVLLDEYRDILSKPIKINFMGKKETYTDEKKELIKKYINIVDKYFKTKFTHILQEIEEPINNSEKCNKCSSPSKFFEILDNGVYICTSCGKEQDSYFISFSYKDIDRINITTKYKYDRRVHFRDCIKQFQGKQNSTIDKSVYEELERQFDLHGLLIGDKDTPRDIRFSKIEKQHIYLFLKDMGCIRHYEDAILIYSNITGKKPIDISHLEDKLIEDYDTLVELYDKKFKNVIGRTNFINVTYIFYQLLKKHKFICNRNDFSILKTIDRRYLHDDLCKEIFSELGWSFSPFF